MDMHKSGPSSTKGNVELFSINIPTAFFSSINRIVKMGRHKTNNHFCVNRPDGYGSGIGILLFTLSGRGEITLDQKKYIAKSGSIAVIPPNCSHAYSSVINGEWEFYFICYAGEHAIHCTNDIVKNNDYLFQFDEKLIQVLFEDYIENKSKGIERELDDSAWLERIFQILLKKSVSMACNESESRIVQDMLMFIERSKDSDFSLDVLSKQYHYSKEHLIRVFQKAMGTSPYKYWVLLKLNQSCYELEKNERSISEIARACGYKHVGSYSVEFKKRFHMSPQDYREMFQFQKNKANKSDINKSDES